MKLLAILALAVLAASHLPAQTEAVIKTKATDALTESIVIPSGKSVTIASGASIINNGTATGFGGGGGSLDDISDVTITSVATNDFFVKSAGDWVNMSRQTAINTLLASSGALMAGDIFWINSSGNAARLAGSNGYLNCFTDLSGNKVVQWATISPDLENAVTGILPVANGGTGQSTLDSWVTNTMLAGSIALSKLSITGTPTGSKFLRDDGSWAAASTDLASPGPIGGTTPSTGVFTQLSVASGTLTDSAPVTITQAWNDAAEAFTGIRMDITSTASASSSSIIDLRIGGTSNFRVSRSGGIYLAGGSVIFDEGGNINGASNAALRAGGRGYNVGVGTYAVSFSDSGPVAKSTAQYLWCDSVHSYAGTIDTGIARSAAGSIQVTDGSTGYGTIQDLYRRVGSGSPEGAITAPVGCIYHRTDTGDIWRKTSGTGNTGWVTP